MNKYFNINYILSFIIVYIFSNSFASGLKNFAIEFNTVMFSHDLSTRIKYHYIDSYRSGIFFKNLEYFHEPIYINQSLYC